MKSVIYHSHTVRNAVTSYMEKDLKYHDIVVFDIDDTRSVVVVEKDREFLCEILEIDNPISSLTGDVFGPTTLIRVTEILY